MSVRTAFAYNNLVLRSGKPEKYYDLPSYKDFSKKGKLPTLKEGYISSRTPLHSGYGDPLYSKSSRTETDDSFYNNKKINIPGLYIYNDPREAQRQQQQAYQQQLQATAARTQADIAKQLQIVQSEKSAVSKMTQEYTAMLQEEADRRVKAQEEARVSAATSAANQARQGQTSNLQIQPASSTPQTAGTGAFRIRKRRSTKQQQLASSLNIGQSNTLNI
tara:strand:- start:45 stop:701 length:657 start_codon:yes stop_codon:yes gene_type:complete